MEKLEIVAQKSVGCTMDSMRDSTTRVNDAGMDAGWMQFSCWQET